MLGKICVLSGATSGIGLASAEALSALGMRLVLIARDKARAEAALARLAAPLGTSTHSVHYADLSSIAETKRVAGAIARAHPAIDVLINCAGSLFARRRQTVDGLEMTFALNHLSYFILTNMLQERLMMAAPARIVNVASRAHHGATLDFSDLQMTRHYGGFTAYRRSKLANILFTRAMAKRLIGTGVTVNALHPGFVATRLGADNRFARYLIRLAMMRALPPAKGAETVVYLATSPEVAHLSGKYFADCRMLIPDAPAEDDEAEAELWRESVRLTGIGAT